MMTPMIVSRIERERSEASKRERGRMIMSEFVIRAEGLCRILESKLFFDFMDRELRESASGETF
jgi:hypothetical protein